MCFWRVCVCLIKLLIKVKSTYRKRNKILVFELLAELSQSGLSYTPIMQVNKSSMTFPVPWSPFPQGEYTVNALHSHNVGKVRTHSALPLHLWSLYPPPHSASESIDPASLCFLSLIDKET